MRFEENSCMIELRISEAIMQKSNDKQKATKAHRQLQSSTTLNRRYVTRPAKSTTSMSSTQKSPRIQHFAQPTVKTRPQQSRHPVAPAQPHPIQATAQTRMRARSGANINPATTKLTARQLKDQAIQKALAAASTDSTNTANNTNIGQEKTKHHFGLGRVILALSCAAAAVFAIVYFVNLNMPDISLKVAAMQTGIEATYPSYVPRDYNLAGIVSEDGKITLNFSNTTNGDTYSLTEENSSWDSNALLTNFVKERYGDNYVVVREQGLTIYISGSNASWTNGGIVYILDAASGALSKKQIISIATSL